MEINLSSRETACHKDSSSSKESENKTIDIDLESAIKSASPIHFIGIGGIGMSALARILLKRGIKVSGSDRKESEITEELSGLGADIHIGHDSKNFDQAQYVVVSTAIQEDNPEVKKARELSIPIVHRSDMLKALTKGSKLVGVSGTHGKTTTTGMIAQVLIDGGLDPSVVVGGVFPKIGSNSRSGSQKSGYFVAEVDESDGTQIGVKSYISLITNIETDHLENYPGGLKDIVAKMTVFAKATEQAVILCADDERCMEIRDDLSSSSSSPATITYGKRSGTDKQPDYSFSDPDLEDLQKSRFSMRVFKGDEMLGDVELSVPGEHNKYNVLASLIVAMLAGMSFADAARSLGTFTGVNRRFQILGEEKGILVVDDYAHHPTEVQATLSGARDYIVAKRNKGATKARLVALFQPHQPSRLKNHWEQFLNSFKDADLVLISDIYVARGKGIEGVNSEKFSSEIPHDNAHYLAGKTGELAAKVIPFLEPNDLVMTIGAGDITSVGPELLELLKQS